MPLVEPLEPRRLFSTIVPADTTHLTAAEVSTILAQAASQAAPTQAAVVVDREGVVLGIFALAGAPATRPLKRKLTCPSWSPSSPADSSARSFPRTPPT